MQTTIEKELWKNNKVMLPFILSEEKLTEQEDSRLDLFEKGLEADIKKSDTIEMAVEKIVKMALAAEFGPSLLTSPGSRAMINTISYGILHDSEMRKQVLLIVDRFAK